ncbi:STE11-like protein [Mycena kentingensis (nom. inval.)]|nr:STE11-like protein [Mycena kentingensis (nom. inval.)]
MTTVFTEYPPVANWNDTHIKTWLADIKCAGLAETFRANDIRGDILLELDGPALQEMGIASIGDRLRIANAVKALRQRKLPATPVLTPRLDISPEMFRVPVDRNDTASPTSRLANRVPRPAPLQLSSSGPRNDLPRLVREQQPPDSARPSTNGNGTNAHTVRPLPQPSQTQQNSSAPSNRPGLPPLPPPPSGKPPVPPTRTPVRGLNSQLPGRRTPDVPPYANQPLPPAPISQAGLLTPSSATNWTGLYLPDNPRPGNAGGGKTPTSVRSNSPLLTGRPRGAAPTIPSHVRGSSLNSPNSKAPSRSTPSSNHPYQQPQSSLQTPINAPASNLSPIEESFNQPPTTPYTVGIGPFKAPNTPSVATPSLDDLRRKLVRFLLPDEGQSFTVDIGSCGTAIEVMEKVLRKFGKGSSRAVGERGPDVQETHEGGLSVDGWGVYLDAGGEDGLGEALSEAELLSICHAPPNHPVREHGLTLRRTGIPLRSQGALSPQLRGKATGILLPMDTGMSKAYKRASSISILSGLGVDDPERALEPPSPTVDNGRLSPSHAGPSGAKARPSKLHNFFGQRPPSELITHHLTEYFPLTDKKVLARTARQSMIFRNNTRSKRDSTASWNAAPMPQSRFSTSTQGSGRASTSSPRNSFSSYAPLPPPPPPDSQPIEDIPRVSLSTEDGRSVDLQDISRSPPKSGLHPQLLPPIPFPTESLSESIENITSPEQARIRRSLSAASANRRMSFMTELRSKRDKTDTASLLTVDEITADIVTDRDRTDDEWTKVESEDGDGVVTPLSDPEATDEEATLNDDGDEEEDDDEDDDDEENEDDDGKGSAKAGKWIKGALIGAGSFGKVYLGMDAASGLLMAVKQVELPTGSAPNQERKKSMLSALEREIELLKDLQHVNIVQYLYSSLDDEYLNIFLEYVPGGSVTALLRNYGAFEETLVKNFVRQILEGLNYLHERDIIHRDIKGANILVDNKGGVKISDFGISKKVDDNLLTGNRMHRPSLQGSVFWMAPEVVKQTAHTPKADIWSVGCLVVEMLTGEHPWATLTQMQAIFKIGSSAKPTIPTDISADAQDFLTRTFATPHEERPSAPELLKHHWLVVPKKEKGGSKKLGQAPMMMVEVPA